MSDKHGRQQRSPNENNLRDETCYFRLHSRNDGKNMNAALLLLMIITKQSIRNTEVDKMEYN